MRLGALLLSLCLALMAGFGVVLVVTTLLEGVGWSTLLAGTAGVLAACLVFALGYFSLSSRDRSRPGFGP